MSGRVKYLLDGAAFHDAPEVHHCYPVCNLGNHPKIMGDEEDRHSKFLNQVLHQVEDLGLNGDIQGRGWFIRNQNLGFGGECHGDHRTLAHPPGEFKSILVEPFISF